MRRYETSVLTRATLCNIPEDTILHKDLLTILCLCAVAFLMWHEVNDCLKTDILYPLCTLCVCCFPSHRCLHQISMDSAALEQVLTVFVQLSCIQRQLLVRMTTVIHCRLSVTFHWLSSSLNVCVKGCGLRRCVYWLTLEW
jgi:hypothetical protein